MGCATIFSIPPNKHGRGIAVNFNSPVPKKTTAKISALFIPTYIPIYH